MKEKMQRRHGTVRTLLAAFAIAFVCMPAGQTQAATLGPNVTQRTQNQIYEYLMSHDVSTKDMHTFSSEPVLDKTAQIYEAGELAEESKKAALQIINNIRYIAGLNPTVTLDENYGELAQAGAFVDYSIGTLTHYPKQDGTKPAGMSDELWDLGATGAGKANIAYNQDTLNEAVLGWMSDEDMRNISVVGHRRWILNPTMGKTGFGAADKYYAMYSVDRTNTSASQTRVVWPAQEMPVEYFDGTLPWSISVGSSISNTGNVKVTLTRQGDGQEWVFDTISTSISSNTHSKYYGIDNGTGVGLQGCIIFRPENFTFQAGDVYHVKAENVNGNTIEYDVHFFNGFSATKASFAKEEYYALKSISTSLAKELHIGPGEAVADSVVWTSSDESVFRVDQSGNVTGRGNGSATLTVTVNGTIEAKCKITVLQADFQGTAEYAGGVPVPAQVVVTNTVTGEELEIDKDYHILYYNSFHTAPTEPSITEVGATDYISVIIGKVLPGVSYSFNRSYRVIPKTITEDMITITPETFEYSGSEQKPEVVVKNGDVVMQEGTDYTLEFSGGVDAGDYTVTVKAGTNGNYTGSASKAFRIEPKDVSDEIKIIPDEDLVYNGQEQLPDLAVMLGEEELTAGKGYEFALVSEDGSEVHPVDAGDYAYTVSGSGNYAFSVKGTFTINPKKLDESMVKVDELTYNGKDQTPIVTVSDQGDSEEMTGSGQDNAGEADPEQNNDSPSAADGADAEQSGAEIITEDDYDIKVPTVKDVDTYTATVTGKRNYTGTLEVKFDVLPASLKTVTVEPIEDQTYTGSEITPAVTLMFEPEEGALEEPWPVPLDDYTYTYSENNIDIGTVNVTIKPRENRAGKTNFKDETETTFEIVPASLEKAVVEVTPDSAVYSGTEQKVSVSVMLGETQIEEGNYDVAFFDADGNEAKLIDAGNYEVKVTGKGNYKDSASGAFTISPKPITEDMIQVSGDGGLVYNGTAQNPSVKVEDSERGVDLVEGKDFEVSFNEEQEAKNAGSYVLRVSGKGNYTSDVDKKFVIEQKALTADMVKVDQLVYNGKEQEPVVTVSDMAVPGDGADGVGTDGAGGKVGADGAQVNLITADDYEISVEKVKDAGTYQVSVTALEAGNYTGNVTAEFEVQPESLKNVTIREVEDQTYTGSAIEPKIVLTFKGQELEVPQDDFIVEYAPGTNINVGSVKVTIKPNVTEDKPTNFKDQAETTFDIVPASLEKAVVSVKPDSAVYSGTEQKVSVNVILGETQIDEGNYDVAFLDADGNEAKLTDAGNYEVKVTGKGNYKDSASGAFTIAQKPVTKDMVNVSDQDLIYSGSGQAPVITVTDGEMQLKEGTDYTVTITAKLGEDGSQGSVNGDGKAVDAGSYTVKINGKGNYTSEADGYEFKVVPKQITEDMIDEIPQQDAEAAEYAMPELTIRDGEQVLKAGKDFTVEYVDNSGVGDGKALVEGIGNYTGSAEKSFKICRNIDKAVVELENVTYEEDGTEKKPAVTVTLDDKLLEAEKDYKVSYKDNVKAGTATAVVTGTGYYMGSVSKEFTINAKPQPQTEEKPQEQGGDGITEPMSPENAPTSEAVNQEVTKMSDNAEIKGSGFAILQANAKKIGKNYVKLGWNRVKGAQGYIIYGNRCGTKFKMQKIKTIYSGGATSFKVKKLADGKTKLKAGTYYKFVVLAFAKDSKGAEKIIASSKSVHFITTGHKKYSNYKGVKVSKSKVTVKKGRTVKITAKAIVPSGKKVSAHRKLKCESTDPTAVKATINGAGTVVKIKGLKKTKKPVIVYVYAQSGKFAKIKVTVK